MPVKYPNVGLGSCFINYIKNAGYLVFPCPLTQVIGTPYSGQNKPTPMSLEHTIYPPKVSMMYIYSHIQTQERLQTFL